MRNHRITKPDFRPARCSSRSQAPFCLYTLRMISNHSGERAPPLPFRRRPPQSNCPSDTVSQPDKGCRLSGHNARVVSLPPSKLASRSLRLLPILYMRYRHSISNYSKAPWGLSVLSRVTCIFTGTKIHRVSLRPQIVTPFVRVGTYPTRISLP